MLKVRFSSASLSVIIYSLSLIGLLGQPAQAQPANETILYTFTNSAGDGAYPAANLIIDSSGNLFGTTSAGGTREYGSVFELVDSSGIYSEKVLYSLSDSTGQTAGPSGLIMDASGNLYGTAERGGTYGYGTVFELVNSSGTYSEKVLYNFTNSDGDGAYPEGGVTMDASGNLYGTTTQSSGGGYGTVFELVNSSGTYNEKILQTFTYNFESALNPSAGLMMDTAGNLYGTSSGGGTIGYGTVFELVNSSGTYTQKLLHSFSDSGGDGAFPYGGVIMDAAGNLYGTTSQGGTNGDGTVFELVNSSGTYGEWVLHNFTGSAGDGQYPSGGLIMDAAGNLYGVTPEGGPNDYGTVFELVNSSGSYSEKVLHTFTGSAGDGEYPSGGLVMDSAGNLYGATSQGGTYLVGTVFELINPASVSVTSNLNPSAYGQAVTFTATIGTEFGEVKRRSTRKRGRLEVVNGTVTWSSNTGCGTTNVTAGYPGTATCTTSSLGHGTDTVTAAYNGNYNTASGSVSQDVGLTANTVSWTTAPPASAPYNSQFTVAASGLGTGAITYSASGGCTVSGSAYTMIAASGTCMVTATQASDNNYSSGSISSTVAATDASTTTTVSSSRNPSAYNGSVSFTASVTSGGNPITGGTVQFVIDGSNFGSATALNGSGQVAVAISALGLSAGTHTVQANYSGFANYASSSGSLTQTVDQTVTFTSVTSSVDPSTYGQSVSFTASVGGAFPTGTVQFQIDGTNFGTPITMNSGFAFSASTSTLPVGNHTVLGVYSGDTNNAGSAGTISGGQVVNKASQTISCGFPPPPSSAVYNSNFTMVCTASSGLAVIYTSAGGCSNSGATYTMTSGTTACTIDVNQSGNSSYNAATQMQLSITANKAGDTVLWTTVPPSTAVYNSNFTVAASGASTGAISYTSGGACSNSGATYTMTSSTGTCTVTVTQATDNNYIQGTLYTEVTAATAGQTITVTTAPPSSAAYNSTFPVAATASSNLAVTITSSGSCSGSGTSSATITITAGTGACSVLFTQAGNANYLAASGVRDNINAMLAANTMTWTTSPPASAEYGSSFTVAASGLGTGAITYTSDGLVCTNSGATYTMISGTGACAVMAAQAADNNYQSASASGSVTAEPANASVSVTTPGPSTYGQSVTFTAAISSNTGAVKGRRTTKRPRDLNGSIAWTWTDVNNNVHALPACNSTVSGNPPQTVTCTTSVLAIGSDAVTATYTASDSNHTTASGSVNQTVGLAANTVTFTTQAPASAEYGSSFTVAASGLGTGAITYTSDGVVCANSGTTYTMISGTGTCTVTATQAADGNYPTASASESVTAEPAQISVTVSTPGASAYGQSVTFTATIISDTGAVKSRRTTRRPRDLNGAVSWSSSTGCTISTVSGNPPQTATCTTSILGGGTDTVTATYTANDGNHNSTGGSVKQTVNPASQTITVVQAAPPTEVYNGTFTVAATASSSLAAAIASTGSCSGSGSGSASITMTNGTGSCLVTFCQAGNANYSAAPCINESVTATPASQSITVTRAAPSSAIDASSFNVAATANSGLAVVISGSGSCSGSGSGSANITMGSTAKVNTNCTVTYSQSGNSIYTAATTLTSNTKVAKPTVPTVSFVSNGTLELYGTTFTATASSNETGVVSDPVITSGTPTICTVTGSTSSGAAVTATIQMQSGEGSCDLSASWAINTFYKAAGKSLTVTAGKAAPTASFTGAPATANKGATFTVTASSTNTAVPALTASGSCTMGSASNTAPGTYQALVTVTRSTGTCTTKAAWAVTADFTAASAKEITTAE